VEIAKSILRRLRLFTAKLFMKPDDFESRLQRQPLRPIPPEWRAKMLATARAAQTTGHPSPATRHHWLATFNQQLSTLLWPHPKAWAGLAAIWIFIFAVNFSLREASPRTVVRSAPPSPEVMVELRKQQKLLAELIGPREEREADRSKTHAPRSRTERVELLVA
jgi:hypothetical protein